MTESAVVNLVEASPKAKATPEWCFETASVALLPLLVARMHTQAGATSTECSAAYAVRFARANTRKRAPAYGAELLESVRLLPAKKVLCRLQESQAIASWKVDAEFRPTKDPSTRRVYVGLMTGFVAEILITQRPGADLKWHDGRLRAGGGGAIDLVMHLTGLKFKQAVSLLTASSG